MSVTKQSGQKRPTHDIGLFMECEEEEMSPVQLKFYSSVLQEYHKFYKQLDDYNSKKGAKVVIIDGGTTVFELLLEEPVVKSNYISVVKLSADTRPKVVSPKKIPQIVPRPVIQTNLQMLKEPNPPPIALNVTSSLQGPTSGYVKRPGAKVQKKSWSEGTAVGGLIQGTKTICKLQVADLCDSAITIGKNSSKTYPSLMCIVRPRINPKVSNLSVSQSDRSVLDAQVKGFLMLPAKQFCDWLLQQGLVRKTQYCPIHWTTQLKPVKLQLAHNKIKDISKFVFSGGYLWYGECCKLNTIVSIFNGSIFEMSPHPPSVILKLIYHWACQTIVPNILQWVKVDTLYVRNIYSLLRATCVLSMNKKFGMLGGLGKKVEVGFIHVRNKETVASRNSAARINIAIIGLLDVENKRVRLLSTEPGKNFFSRLVGFLVKAVDGMSTFCIDKSIDQRELILAGFKFIEQSPTANKNITIYLRETVLKVFPSGVNLSCKKLLQQLLDELAWRERWGPTAMAAFSSMIKHLSDYTAENLEEGLISRLSGVAANPFFAIAEGTGPYFNQCDGKRKRESEHGPLVPANKRLSDTDHASPNKRICFSMGNEWWTFQPAQKLDSETLFGTIRLDSYYLGSIAGKRRTLNFKLQTIRCVLCHRSFMEFWTLMGHLILHCQIEPSLVKPLHLIRQCQICFVGFETSHDLKRHLLFHKTQEDFKGRVCLICEVQFVTQADLIYHMHRCHVGKDLPYGCRFCGFRTSSYSKYVHHIKVHQSEPILFCPFCSKIVTVVAENGDIIKANMMFFVEHIRRHFSAHSDISCQKCRLRFVHSTLLEEHLKNDHTGYEGNMHVQTFPDFNCVFMAEPGSVTLAELPEITRPPKLAAIYSKQSLTVNIKLNDTQYCAECEGIISSKHFTGIFKCKFCRYSTCCEQAADEHYRLYHQSGTLYKYYDMRPKLVVETFTCPCGFYSYEDKLASHMIFCCENTVYRRNDSFLPTDELTVLNTVGLVRKSPELAPSAITPLESLLPPIITNVDNLLPPIITHEENLDPPVIAHVESLSDSAKAKSPLKDNVKTEMLFHVEKMEVMDNFENAPQQKDDVINDTSMETAIQEEQLNNERESNETNEMGPSEKEVEEESSIFETVKKLAERNFVSEDSDMDIEIIATNIPDKNIPAVPGDKLQTKEPSQELSFKTEEKESAGSLIEELESIINSESPDFMSDLMDPPAP